MTLQDARILIIGGGSGIGYAVAEAAMAEGAEVTIASTDAVKLAKAGDRLGGATSARLDLTDEAAVAAFFANSGFFDHIVSTAGDWGKARRGPFTEMDFRDARALFEVRFWGAANLAKHGAAAIPPGGSLTLTSGMSAFRPQKGSVMATAMAGSIAHLVYGLAVELAPVRVNGVFPGGVATEIFQTLPPAVRAAEEARFLSQPVPRIATPPEVAQAYLYAMRCTYVTGQILQVDGGGMLSG
ncbi:MAG: SDR family oxidoreductase [Sphingomonadales bacterium]|nr:SDR family oxidoreductase [Sphingomonadales bacterium]